tara:strand:+ start:2966 stop:3562 length:597 start_codon:yes stop_codon:yes gene_type:complete
MSDNTTYREKYLKYKQKYQDLKEEMEGAGLGMDGADVYEVDCKVALVPNEKGGSFPLDKLGISSKEMMENPNEVRKFFITYGKMANVFKIAATKKKTIGTGLKRISALQIRTGTVNVVAGTYEGVTIVDGIGITLTVGGQMMGGDDTKIQLLLDGMVAKKHTTPEADTITKVCSAKKGPPMIPKEMCDFFEKLDEASA